MMTPFLRVQRWQRDLTTKGRGPVRRRKHRQLAIDALEDRVVMSADLNFNDFADVAGLDTAGNLYVYGDISRSYDSISPPLGAAADLDPGPDTAWLVGSTTYLAKYTPDKSLLWAKRTDDLFSAADAKINDVAVLSSGGQDFIYVMWGGTVSATRTITRFQDTGAGLTPLWQTQTGRAGWITISGDGSVYMNGEDASLAKWDVNGAFQWVRQISGTRDVWIDDVAVVNDGTREIIYACGIFNGTFSPQGYTGPALTDQGSVTNSGDQDGYVVGYDTAGNFVSVGQFVDARVRQVTGDAGGTYIAGTHYYAALGLPGTRNDDIFFGKLNAGGRALAWVKGLPGPASNTVGDLIAANGSLVLTGNFWGGLGGAMDFDPGAGKYNLTPAGGGDSYVASYGATDGAFRWARLMGSSTSGGTGEAGTSLVASGTDLYVGGFFGPGQATVGADTLTGTAGFDGFIARMSSTDGGHRWAFSVGSLVRTLDDGDAGYSESGSGWKNNTDGGFGSDSRYHMKGSGGNKAQWVFTGLPAGNYEVLATWKAGSKNTSNAAYSVNGTAVTRSQRVAPDDYRSDFSSTLWESLGSFAPGIDGKLTVTLSDKADGNVVADAIRLVFKVPSANPSGLASSGTATQTMTFRQGQPLAARTAKTTSHNLAIGGLVEDLTLQNVALGRIETTRKPAGRGR